MSDLELKGADVLVRNLEAMGPRVQQVAGVALYEVGLVKLAEMNRRAALDVQLERPIVTRSDVSVRFSVSGTAVVRVHEEIEKRHGEGEPKYMEAVILDAKSTLAAELAERIDLGRAVS